MIKNKAITIDELFADVRAKAYDEEAKLGSKITFTKEELVVLEKLVGTRTWDILTRAYAKQRLIQIAVANLNVSQDANQLAYYKGQAFEISRFEQNISNAVNQFREREKADKSKSAGE